VEYVGELKALANQMAAREQAKLSQIEKRLTELEEEKASLEARRDLASTAHERALNFQPVLGADYQCPSCWIVGKGAASLRPIDGKPGKDLFRCGRCDEEFSFIAR